MALNANALVTLNAAKAYLKIPLAETSKDSHIELLINSASEYLERECDRVLKKVTGIVEYQDGNNTKVIVTKQWPITAVSELKLDSSGSSAFGADTVVASGDRAITDDDTAILLIADRTPRGQRTVKITYDAGYATIPADLQEACLWVVYWKDRIRDAGDIGRTTKNKEGESISYLQDAPKDVRDAIARYKRTDFFGASSTTQQSE